MTTLRHVADRIGQPGLGSMASNCNVSEAGARVRWRTARSKRMQDAELDELRRKYDHLCTRIAEDPGGDPAAEGEIIDELQRLSDRIVALAETGRMSGASGSNPGPNPGSDKAAEGNPDRMETGFKRVLALLEQQNKRVEHILRRSDEHRDQLERMERRLIETTPLIERQLPEIRAATELQRERITALAVAVQRLLQWLVARHGDRP